MFFKKKKSSGIFEFAKRMEVTNMENDKMTNIRGGEDDYTWWDHFKDIVADRWEQKTAPEPTYRERVNAGSNGVER